MVYNPNNTQRTPKKNLQVTTERSGFFDTKVSGETKTVPYPEAKFWSEAGLFEDSITLLTCSNGDLIRCSDGSLISV